MKAPGVNVSRQGGPTQQHHADSMRTEQSGSTAENVGTC